MHSREISLDPKSGPAVFSDKAPFVSNAGWTFAQILINSADSAAWGVRIYSVEFKLLHGIKKYKVEPILARECVNTVTDSDCYQRPAGLMKHFISHRSAVKVINVSE